MTDLAQHTLLATKGTVLVVDDDAMTRRLAKEMLAKLGYESEAAVDGEEALDALCRCDYAAVLMDCYMPKLNGFDATATLRQREGQTRHTPVIAMTVSGSTETAHRCGAVGVDGFLIKPVGMGDLEELLDYWTHRSFNSRIAAAGSD
ncbi:MAG: two-component system, OmpR family, response regulator [Actinomycetota bacterium]|jgi:CheY-like chemotaxis protein